MILQVISPYGGPSPARVVIVFVLMYLGVTGIFALNRHLKRPPKQ